MHVHENLYTVLIRLCKYNLMPILNKPHYALKKIKTATAISSLISNTVVPNPYSHSTAFDPQSFVTLS